MLIRRNAATPVAFIPAWPAAAKLKFCMLPGGRSQSPIRTNCCSRNRDTPSSISRAITSPWRKARCAALAADRTCWCDIPTGSKVSTSIKSGRRRVAPTWIEVVELRFPSGRVAEEVVPRDAAALAWLANLACLELHPHPVRAEDLEHPDELRVDLDPVPGILWQQVQEVAAVSRAVLHDFGLSAGRRRRARAACTSACASNSDGISTKCGARRLRWRAKSRSVRRSSPPASGGRRSATVCSSTTTRTPRTVRLRLRTPCGQLRTRAFRRRSPGMKSTDCDPADFTLASMPARFERARRPARGDRPARRLDRRSARTVRASGARRCAVATALPQSVRGTASRPAVQRVPASRPSASIHR